MEGYQALKNASGFFHNKGTYYTFKNKTIVSLAPIFYFKQKQVRADLWISLAKLCPDNFNDQRCSIPPTTLISHNNQKIHKHFKVIHVKAILSLGKMTCKYFILYNTSSFICYKFTSFMYHKEDVLVFLFNNLLLNLQSFTPVLLLVLEHIPSHLLYILLFQFVFWMAVVAPLLW